MTNSPDDGAQVTVRYWAGARAAAGVSSDVVGATSVSDVIHAASALHPALAPVLAIASFLVDGIASGPDSPVAPGAVVEVLPPFAGG